VLALSALLRPGDVLLTEGNTRAAALVRRVTRSPWAHVSIYAGPLHRRSGNRRRRSRGAGLGIQRAANAHRASAGLE
jgi:hypothetical protein